MKFIVNGYRVKLTHKDKAYEAEVLDLMCAKIKADHLKQALELSAREIQNTLKKENETS